MTCPFLLSASQNGDVKPGAEATGWKPHFEDGMQDKHSVVFHCLDGLGLSKGSVIKPSNPDSHAWCAVSQSLSHQFEAEKALSSEVQPNKKAGELSQICLTQSHQGLGYILLAKDCGGRVGTRMALKLLLILCQSYVPRATWGRLHVW